MGKIAEGMEKERDKNQERWKEQGRGGKCAIENDWIEMRTKRRVLKRRTRKENEANREGFRANNQTRERKRRR